MGSQAPVGEGVVELIVRRPAQGEREVLDEAELDVSSLSESVTFLSFECPFVNFAGAELGPSTS